MFLTFASVLIPYLDLELVYIVSVPDEMGRSDLAFSLLFKETYPSWFYSINQGATTMWERWNSYSKEDGFSGDKMNSLNHYAHGAVDREMNLDSFSCDSSLSHSLGFWG